ncbi:MAG: aminotransferase class III-fold pyridoxal phosphate-dependent enzyme, partial [Hyphomicrobiaceae bacterium]
IMIEPIQGEGGIRSIPTQCLVGLRELCDKHGLLLILDEVQCGVGRTGKLFAHEWAGITPDIMAIAKGIGGGFPVGAFLATDEACKGMVPGTHGSTFGGNMLAMAVGNAVLDKILEPGFLEAVQQKALYLKQSLARVKDENPGLVEEIRGQGLLMGLKINAKVPSGDVVKACTAEKFLTVGAGDNVVRIIPPLNVTEAEISEAVNRLGRALKTAGKPA